MTIAISVIHGALLASTLPNTWRWWQASQRVQPTQDRIWQRIAKHNAGTTFGREYDFRHLRSVREMSRTLPVMSSTDLEQYLQQWHAGDRTVLTAEPIQRFLPTSGTSGARKLIPYTQSLLAEFQAGIDPWLASLYGRYPALMTGCAYWQITPVSDLSSTGQDSGDRFENDSTYLGRRRASLTQLVMAVPDGVATSGDLSDFQERTLRCLVQRSDLAFISIWNPTFLVLLLDALPGLVGQLYDHIRTIDRLRANQFKATFDHWSDDHDEQDRSGRTWVERLWPQLRVVSCWTDANAKSAAAQLQRRIPNVKLEPKGLVATEALISFPWRRNEHVLSLNSHVFEFIPDDDSSGPAALAHEVELGRTYRVIVTTGGGLYRYQLGDLVRVTGFINRCPTIEFIGRHDGVIDLVGEKISPAHVQEVIDRIMVDRRIVPRFWMVAPDPRSNGPIGYTLYLQMEDGEQQLARLAAQVDRSLDENPHYRYARQLGQLGPPRVFRINRSVNPAGVYLLRQSAHQQLGTIKPPVLDKRTDWSTIFAGSYIP